MSDSIRIKLSKALEEISDVKINLNSIEGQELINDAMREVIEDPDSERSQKLFAALEVQESLKDSRAWEKSNAPLAMVFGQDIPDSENFLLDDYEFIAEKSNDTHDPTNLKAVVDLESMMMASINNYLKSESVKAENLQAEVIGSSHQHFINFNDLLKVARVAEDLLYCPQDDTQSYFLETKHETSYPLHIEAIDAPVKMLLNRPDHSSFEIAVKGEQAVTVEIRPYALIIHKDPVSVLGSSYAVSSPVVVTSLFDVTAAASNMLQRLAEDKGSNYAPVVLHTMVNFFEHEVTTRQRA
ncbi:hypothetical protein [Pseudomonas fluorescens]|uniref:hypothetical protein n=1 Tax=Pseudomonas fluorescens TaxID=294 RepID=UPI003821F537